MGSFHLDKVSQTLPPPPLPSKKGNKSHVKFLKILLKYLLSSPFLTRGHSTTTIFAAFIITTPLTNVSLNQSRFSHPLSFCWIVRMDSLQKDVHIPIYFACKAKSNIYLAFRTVASTWANKLQGKFIDNGSKKASNIPLSSSFPSIIFLTLLWHNDRNRKLGQSNSPMKILSSFTF